MRYRITIQPRLGRATCAAACTFHRDAAAIALRFLETRSVGTVVRVLSQRNVVFNSKHQQDRTEISIAYEIAKGCDRTHAARRAARRAKLGYPAATQETL